MEIQIFPNETDTKWSEYKIKVSEDTKPIMEEIISKTSLIRHSDLQTIEKILRKHLAQG